MKIRIADLRNVVTFLTHTKIPNDSYGYDYAWEEDFKSRGKLETISGTSFETGEQENLAGSHRLIIRYRENINKDHRIHCAGKYFNIVQFDPLIAGRARYLEIFLDEDKVHV